MSHDVHDPYHDMPMNSSTDQYSMPPKGDLMNTTHDHKIMIMNRMSLYWSKDAIVLFSGWPNDHLGMYILALVFVFLLAVAVEVLSVSPTVKQSKSPVTAGFIQSSVYAFRVGFLYLVMLSVMSFNIGIFLSAVAGHTIGFFIVKTRAHVLTKRAEPKH